MLLFHAYDTEPFLEHCVIWNQYLRYGIDDNQHITYMTQDYERGKCDEEGFTISVDTVENTVVIRANREGLLSLANHLVSLAEEVPGSHIHLDEYNALEENSAELIIEKE